jgi:hypothetical protein
MQQESTMPEGKDKLPERGFSPRPEMGEPGLHPSEIVAALLAMIWVGAVVTFVFWSDSATGQGSLGLVMALLVVFLPLALIWISVSTMRTVRLLREEAGRLQSTVEALRNAFLTNQQSAASGGIKASVEKRLDEIAAATRQTESVLSSIANRRENGTQIAQPSDRRAALVVPPRPASVDEQPALALGTPVEEFRAPLSMADFIRALHFPESADDKDGFRALRLALEDRTVARLIRAAQDVLTLLSEEGIYMDDLKPDHAPSDVWRQFAKGERGRAVASLAGIRDRSSLALTAARMREDPVFRDAGHHFLRTFDRTFSAFEPNATDSEISDLASTRTARAFMLIGRVTGTFD